jgi:hypothetical protein
MQSPSNDKTELAVIAVHTQPKNAAKEIDSLFDVAKWTRKKSVH